MPDASRTASATTAGNIPHHPDHQFTEQTLHFTVVNRKRQIIHVF